MITFPNCKINLGLNILRKREDGYHDLETIFYPVGVKDGLEIIRWDGIESGVQYSGSGFPIDGQEENNLCIKAYQLLKKKIADIGQSYHLPAIKMHLHKVIPMGAGLGGGSSDAAFVLKKLNEKFELGLSLDVLLQCAAELGSDGPFFILNKPCFATGRGELLQEILLDLSPYDIVLINPGIHINTGWAFAQLAPTLPEKNILDIVHQPIHNWKTELANDFEKPVFALYPEIKLIKENLYNKGALYAAMSGSGSTVFGIFEKGKNVDLGLPVKYWMKTVSGQFQVC